MITDIVCIGAGPASAFAALEVLKNKSLDLQVHLFEEHPKVGIPIQCAGLISASGFQRLQFRPPQKCIQNTVKGSIFHSPSGHQFVVKRRDIQAYVINRALFDQHLVEKVTTLGGVLHLNTPVLDLQQIQSEKIRLKVKMQSEDEFIETGLVIDGEGVRSKFLPKMNLSPPDRQNNVPALQHEMSNVRDLDRDYVEIYIGHKVSPGFFAYIIPTSESTARVEVASSHGHLRAYMKHFMEKHPGASKKLARARIEGTSAGLIMTGGPVKKTSANNFLVVGDAAGHVKPTTGGGVILGGLCAKLAGQIALEAYKLNDFSFRILKRYDREWKKHYSREFQLQRLVRTLINSLPDRMLDTVFQSFDDSIKRKIEDLGDMDVQSTIIKKLLFSPKSVIFLFNILKHLFF